MADVAVLPVATETPIEETNGLAAEIIEEVQAKLNIGTPEEVVPEKPIEETKEEVTVVESEESKETTPVEETTAEVESKTDAAVETKKGDTINSSSSSGKDDAITESSEANQKVTEKESAGSKSRKSIMYRFRSWWTNMFAVKGEQPSTVTKVVGNLRNSLRRKNGTGTPKKDKKASKSQISEDDTPAVETCEKDSNIEENKEIVAKSEQDEEKSEEVPKEQISKETESKTEPKSDDAVVEETVVETVAVKVSEVVTPVEAEKTD